MNQSNVLETLVIRLVAEDAGLEEALERHVKDAEVAAEKIRESVGGMFDTGIRASQEFAQGVQVATDSTSANIDGLSAAAVGAAQDLKGLAPSDLYDKLEQLNTAIRENHESVRQGEQSREEYRKELEKQREQLRQLLTAYDRAARGFGQFEDAGRGAEDVTEDLDDTIKALSNSVRTQRGLWAGRVTDDEKFRASTEALHREMWELYEAGGLTGEQMKKLANDLSYAQRGIDSVDKVASRGGLAWTARIGITDAFGNSLRGLGPAGDAAAMGIASLGPVFTSLRSPIKLTQESLTGFVKGLGSLVKLMPLIVAGAGVAATAALWRMANAHAALAEQIEVATFRTGLSAEAYQEMAFAAKQAGVDTSILETTLQRLQRRAADANAGNANLIKTFTQLGVQLTDTNGQMLGTEELFNQVADGLAGVENNAEKLRLAFAVFDTEGARLLPLLSRGSEGLAELREQARELGLVISGETIISLNEFRQQVDQLQGQFKTAGVEITAAFLPVLQDLLIPLIQNTVIPWMQEAAKAIQNWATQFVETGAAGDEFRAQVAAWLDPLVRFGRLVEGVVKLLGAVGQGAMSAAASLGAGLGTFIAQLEQMRPLIDDFIEVSKFPVMSPQYLVGMGRLLSNLSDTDITLDGSAVVAAAEEAGRIYHNAAQNLANEGIAAIGTALVGDSFTLELADTIRTAVTRGASSGLSDPLTDFSDDLTNTVAGAVEEGAAEGLERAIKQLSVTFPRPDEGAGGGLTYRPDERFGWDAERRAAEAARAERILAAAQEAEAARLQRIRASYEQLGNILAGHELARAATIAYEAAAGAQAHADSLHALTLTYRELDEAETRRIAQTERVATANADVAESARLAAIAASRLADQDAIRNGVTAYQALAAEFERLTDTTTPLQRLRSELVAFGETGDAAARSVAGFILEIDRLDKGLESTAKGALEVGKAFTGLNRARPTFESDGSRAAFAADLDRMRQEAARAFAGVQSTIDGFLGRNQFDEMRQQVQDAMDASVISIDQFNDALDSIRAMEVNATLRELSGTVGGLGGDFLSIAADVHAAVLEFQETGETLPLVTVGFNAATAAVQAFQRAFADGFDGNEALSGLIGIGSGIATLIGGPAMGEAFAAIGGFVQTVLGDLSNGMAGITKQVKEMAASSRTLTQGTLQAFADASTTRVSRGGFLGWLGFTKAELNKEAMSILTGIAESVAGGLSGAFNAADMDEFRKAFDVGIDKVIQDQIIQGFILGDEVQDAIENITFMLAEGDLAGARAEYEKLRADAEATYEQLQEWNRDLGPDPEPPRDYADAIRDAVRATEDLVQQTASGQLERAFAIGAVGVAEYARLLQSMSNQSIGLSFTRQLDDLDRQIAEAIKEGADAGFIAALQDQKAALQDAYREALENGAHEASEAIKGILGTGVDTLQGAMRSAFENADFTGVLDGWGSNLTDVTRNALITGFLESAAMKGALDTLSNLITDAVIDGVVTEDELKAIQDAGGDLEGQMRTFFDMLEELGLGVEGVTENLKEFGDSLGNVPDVFKITQAQMDALDVTRSMTPSYLAPASFSSGSHAAAGSRPPAIVIEHYGDNYGIDDFNDMVANAVGDADERAALGRYGRTR